MDLREIVVSAVMSLRFLAPRSLVSYCGYNAYSSSSLLIIAYLSFPSFICHEKSVENAKICISLSPVFTQTAGRVFSGLK
jgi:hypothetical protein